MLWVDYYISVLCSVVCTAIPSLCPLYSSVHYRACSLRITLCIHVHHVFNSLLHLGISQLPDSPFLGFRDFLISGFHHFWDFGFGVISPTPDLWFRVVVFRVAGYSALYVLDTLPGAVHCPALQYCALHRWCAAYHYTVTWRSTISGC